MVRLVRGGSGGLGIVGDDSGWFEVVGGDSALLVVFRGCFWWFWWFGAVWDGSLVRWFGGSG